MGTHQLASRLSAACRGGASAVRIITRLGPAGGPADKLFPPTYEGGKYAREKRRINGQEVETVLLDSVQAQANRMELALLEAFHQGQCPIPFLQVRIPRSGGDSIITSLEAPHRIYDAIFRDSLSEGHRFRDSSLGKRLIGARIDNATAWFETSPTALMFGMWDSTGGGGVLGNRVARALVSEIIGLHATCGHRTSSRIDPLGIERDAAVIYRSSTDAWTLDPEKAVKDGRGKAEKIGDGRPSEINHGNIMPSISADEESGGVTISEAVQTTVLSFPQLRRFRFPDSMSGKSSTDRDVTGRAVLAALALYAVARQREEGYFLRSRCHLVPLEPARYEWIGLTAKDTEPLNVTTSTAHEALDMARQQAKEHGLAWKAGPIELTPSEQLVELVRRSDAKLKVAGGEDHVRS
jgi:CRISPR-associated protein Csb1